MTNSGSFQTVEKKATHSFDIAVSSSMQLSLMEIGLGSLLHAFHIPFSGFFLSLNQCFVLNRALLQDIVPSTLSYFLPMTISNTAAILKTLSPYGKKFTPMLAISMQGLLFNLGTLLFGKGLLGRCLGSLMLSLWPMIQPILVYGIIYGSLIFSMNEFFDQMVTKLPWLNDMTIQAIVAGYIFVHMSLTLVVCLSTSLLPARVLNSYDQYITSYSTSPVKQLPLSSKTTLWQKLCGVWKDFTSPIFLLSLVFSGFFFYATVNSLESFFYIFLRLISVAFVTFFLLRNIPAEWCIRAFSKVYLLKRCTPFVEEVLRRIQASKGQ